MKLFGRQKAAPSPRESISKLRDTLDMLEKREDFLQKKIDKELLLAKQNASKNKRGAHKSHYSFTLFLQFQIQLP